jgi:Tol biopolymer transport system component
MGNAFGTPFALSPDGKRIAYVSQDRLWIRELDQFEPREVAGSAGAVRPFWSPNSSNVGFLAGGKLWRAAASAGSATTICTLPDRASDAGGGVWTSDDRILFTTGSSGLLAVSATGGDPKPFVELDSETVDFHQPSALPEGRGAVFAVHRKGASYDTLAVSDGRKYRVILRVDNRQLTNPVYSTTGHVLYHRRPDNPGIWALPFSLSKLEATGEPFLAFPNANFPTVSPDGTLAMVRQAAAWSVQLVWLDRNGQVQGKIGQEPQPLAPFPRLSPDGKRLAIGVIAPGQNDVWIYDLARGTRTRLTFTAGSENLPVWSPSGSRIAFMTGNSLQNFSIAWIAADGTGGPETLAKGWEPSFSPDGKVLLYATLKDAAYDLWYLPLSGERKPAPILESVSRKHYPQLSPDGQYLAYISDESGREEIYLTRFPMAEGKWQVSVNGGLWPRWSAKGDRLFYSEPDNSLWEVAVELRPEVRLGTPRKLFARPRSGVTVPNNWPDGFDVTGDGNRFVVVQATEQHGPATITVIQNWFAEFRNRERK